MVAADRDVRRVRPGHAGVQPSTSAALKNVPITSTGNGVATSPSRFAGDGLDGELAVEHLRAIAAELGIAVVLPAGRRSACAPTTFCCLELLVLQPRHASGCSTSSLGNGVAVFGYIIALRSKTLCSSLSKGSGHQRG